MREVADNVFVVGGTNVNWVLLREWHDLTLIDGGWYGDFPAVEESIRDVGCRPQDVRAVLLTHAHLDHMGSLGRLHERFGTPVYASPREAAHARREYLEQATPADLLRRAGHHGMLGWSLRIVRAGALRRLVVPYAQPFPTPSGLLGGVPLALDLPGHPVPVACPGHTSGHSAFHLPRVGAVVSGDALVTGHPVSSVEGPQLLPAYLSHSQADAIAALEVLGGLDADLLLPGHGEPWRGPVREAAATARERVQAG